MSEKEPVQTNNNFVKVNIGIFLFYTIIGSLLAGTPEVVGFILPIHLVILAISTLFGALFGENAGKAFGYFILFLLVLATIGFSICVGSMSNSFH